MKHRYRLYNDLFFRFEIDEFLIPGDVVEFDKWTFFKIEEVWLDWNLGFTRSIREEQRFVLMGRFL